MLAFLSLLLKDLKRIFADSGFQPFCVLVSTGSGEFFQCDGASWRLHAGVGPARRVAMDTPLLCLRHQFTSSSIGDEFKKTTLCVHG